MVGAQEVSGPRDMGPCRRPQKTQHGYVGAERGGDHRWRRWPGPAQPPGRALAASPGQGAQPARRARGWRGRAPGEGSPTSSDVYR